MWGKVSTREQVMEGSTWLSHEARRRAKNRRILLDSFISPPSQQAISKNCCCDSWSCSQSIELLDNYLWLTGDRSGCAMITLASSPVQKITYLSNRQDLERCIGTVKCEDAEEIGQLCPVWERAHLVTEDREHKCPEFSLLTSPGTP